MDRSGYLDVLCQSARGLQVLLVVSTVSTVVLLGSLGVVEPGSDTYVIAVVQLVTFVGIALLSGSALLLCVRRT